MTLNGQKMLAEGSMHKTPSFIGQKYYWKMETNGGKREQTLSVAGRNPHSSIENRELCSIRFLDNQKHFEHQIKLCLFFLFLTAQISIAFPQFYISVEREFS